MVKNRKKVVVAMSGGVDSSVAAALLQRAGHEVIGAFMRLGTPGGVGEAEESCGTGGGKSHKQGCCSVLDAADARRVADALGIPLYVLNFQEDFGRVIDYFVGEYNSGRTPNPCVRCNDWLKFGKLERYAEAVGADYIASGHYAQIGTTPNTGEPCLMRGIDASKDQSYVLFGIKPQNIAKTLLPVGGYTKPQIRAMAEAWGLPVFNKPDSQEICFVPDGDYAGLVKRRTPERVRAGELVTAGGETVGEHGGHQHFTVGQRRGVGVAFGHPIYVVDIDPAANRVVVGPREELLKKALVADQLNLLDARLRSLAPGDGPVRCGAKIRYNAEPAGAAVSRLSETEIRVAFDAPQAAVAPGQAVVLYDGEAVMGGGWIDRAEGD